MQLKLSPMPTFNTVEFDNVKLFDVIVVGGGAAGIAAAIGARQAAPDGRILVIESESCLGGAATHRGVCAYCGLFTVDQNPRQAVGRIWQELKDRLRAINGTTKSPVRLRGVFQVRLSLSSYWFFFAYKLIFIHLV